MVSRARIGQIEQQLYDGILRDTRHADRGADAGSLYQRRDNPNLLFLR